MATQWEQDEMLKKYAGTTQGGITIDKYGTFRDASSRAVSVDPSRYNTVEQGMQVANQNLSDSSLAAAPTAANYLDQYKGQLQGLYDNMTNARVTDLWNRVNQSKAELDASGEKSNKTTGQANNTQSYLGAQNLQAIREAMASMGLFNSGDNVTEQTRARVATQGAINSNNQQLADILAEIGRSKNNLNTNAISQQDIIKAQAQVDLVNQMMQIAQAQQAQQNWQTSFDYNTGRDAVDDSQWNQNFDWQKALQEAGMTGMYNGAPTLDKIIADRNYNLSLSKGSGSGSDTTQKEYTNQAWSDFYSFGADKDSLGQWLHNPEIYNQIIDATGSPAVYQAMLKAYQAMPNYTKSGRITNKNGTYVMGGYMLAP